MAHLRSFPVDRRWRFLQRMEASGQRPHIKLWTAALHDIGSSMKVETLVAHVEGLWENGYSPDAVTYIPLLEACRRDFRVSEALNIYQQMIGRSVQPINGVFAVLAKVLKDCYAGAQSTNFVTPRSKGTLHVQVILQGMHNSGVPMDLSIASILLIVLSKVCSFANPAETIRLAREIQVAIRKQGLVPTDPICAAVLSCHTATKKGDMSAALAAFEEMKTLGEEVGYRTYASLIKTYSYRGDFAQALDFFNQAVSKGIRFEGRSLGLILTTTAAAGRYEEAEGLFRKFEGGNQLDSFIVAAHIKNCSSQKKLQVILSLCERYHTLFLLDARRGEPHQLHLIPLLLETLSEHPTKVGIDTFCQALGLCGSSLANTCTKLLRNPCSEAWDAFFKVFFDYQATDPVSALELIQHLCDCFWALGRREDSVRLLIMVKEDTNLLQAVTKEGDKIIWLDLHCLMINVGLAMVLLTLREIVARSTKQHYAPVSKGLVVITGKGHRQQLSGGLRMAVQKLLLEYGFPSTKLKPRQGKGAFLIDEITLAHWLATLTKEDGLSRG